jgi:hypothetical protein
LATLDNDFALMKLRFDSVSVVGLAVLDTERALGCNKDRNSLDGHYVVDGDGAMLKVSMP